MNRQESIRHIDATLKAAGFIYTGPGSADYEGYIRVHGRQIDVRVEIPDVQFVSRPRIYLKDRAQVPVQTLAHVEEDTGICYTSGVGLPLDFYDPGPSILRVLKEVERTLELSYAGRGKLEFIDEYQQYWKSELQFSCFIPRRDLSNISKCYLFVATAQDEHSLLCLSSEPVLSGYAIAFPSSVHIIRADAKLGPGGEAVRPNNLEQFKSWYESQSSVLPLKWNIALQYLLDEKYLFIVGDNAFLGIKLELPTYISHAITLGSIRKNSVLPIVENMAKKVSITRVSGRWASMDDISLRNSADSKSLSDVSIALIGCGTIGSNLARFLVQSGAGISGKFSIYDNQILTEGNIGRHLLGFADIGKPKATALATELQRFHPQVKVSAFNVDIFNDLKAVGSHDLIIECTGEWNVQSAVNEWFLENKELKAKALLHSWVFMNGAGVQSFLNLRDGFACFRCLKPAFDGPWRFPAGDESDELNLRPATCGDGSYVPFTVDIPAMAASLANRAALDWANDHSGPRLRTVMTDYARGRFQKPRSPQPSEHCPACSKLRRL